MTRYLISFNDGDMDFPEEDFPEVGRAAHEVMAAGVRAGIWEGGGGFMGYSPVVVRADGTVTPGPLAQTSKHIGGFTVVNVESDEAAFEWARKIAVACRCPQEVRRIMDDEIGDEIYRTKGQSF